MLIRRGAAVLLVLFGLSLGLLAIGSSMGVEHTIANAKRLDQQFRQTASAIAAFRKSENRLPSQEELDGLLSGRAAGVYQIMLMPNGVDQCEGDTQPYRHVADGDYILAAWRGEWWECYAPASNKSTLTLHASDFTSTGNIGRDRLVWGVLALASFLFAAFLWRRGEGRENGAAGED